MNICANCGEMYGGYAGCPKCGCMAVRDLQGSNSREDIILGAVIGGLSGSVSFSFGIFGQMPREALAYLGVFMGAGMGAAIGFIKTIRIRKEYEEGYLRIEMLHLARKKSSANIRK